MARTQTMVQLNDALLSQLDEVAAASGVSRSAVIRTAVTEFLAERRADRLVERYLEGYRRQPPKEPDVWGDLAAANDRAGHELAQRLDSEADAAGVAW